MKKYVIFRIFGAALAANTSAMMTPSSSETILSRLQVAMDLTRRANQNPSIAYDACKLWSSILAYEEIPLTPDGLSAAHALYASALTRIGRDKDAINEYQTSLDYMEKYQTNSKISVAEIDVRMGLGKSLQRLLRYHEAKEVFMDIITRCFGNDRMYSNYSEGVKRAVLCCLRVGDAKSAVEIISNFETFTINIILDPEITGMKSVLLLLHPHFSSEDRVQVRDLLKYASDENASILYKWLYLATEQKQLKSQYFAHEDIHQFLEINNCAFDDPCLVYLDDKLLLNSVVLKYLEKSEEFYQQTFVLPQELSSFHDACREEITKKWMLKDRSGYGSHGNRVVSAAEILSDNKSSMHESLLCQKIIHPPMLLNGRKFSLRIYVVYFPEGASLVGNKEIREARVFLSTEGLVKFAAADVVGNDSLEDQYMTNSGRGDGRSAMQYDLIYLKKQLDKNDAFGYDKLWNQIQNTIKHVMSRYISLRSKQFSTRNKSLDPDSFVETGINHKSPCLSCIPKILGFDFMLDAFEKPWLLEVNRFPGLEPRSSMDAAVKANVIYDAWLTASDRVGLSREVLKNIRPSGYLSYSLVEIDTEHSLPR